MAISNFIPEVWTSKLLVTLRDQLVYGGLVNHDYEGDISAAGDTVHITSIDDVSAQAYTGTVAYGALTDDTRALLIDQADYFGFKVDDINKRQALAGFVEQASVSASYNMSARQDSFVAGLMYAGATGDNALGDRTVDTAADAYDLLLELRTRLVRSKAPSAGRFVVVSPEFYAKLLRDDRFVRLDASGTTEGLRNGQVGRAAGFDVIESNTVPEIPADDPEPLKYKVVAGHSMATTVADNLVKTEAIRLETTFGDGIRGLHVYGGKVVRPELLVSADVDVTA